MNPSLKKIILETTETIHILDVDDIIRCESHGNYTRFHFLNDKPLLMSKTLKEYEELLSSYLFIRIHHSHLINLNHLKKYLKSEGCAIMIDGTSIPVSQRKKGYLLDLLITG